MKLVMIVVALSACGGTKRSPAAYRADTQRVLETRVAQIEGCYREVLTTDASAGGTVAVQFLVAKETGRIEGLRLEPGTSTANDPVVQCVLRGLVGLQLEPPDRNDGKAAFVFELHPTT